MIGTFPRAVFGTAVLLLGLCLALTWRSSGPAHGQQLDVPGRWGNFTDPDAQAKLASDRDRIEHFRRQQMRAISAHYRSIEAIVTYQAPMLPLLGAETRKLADLAGMLPALFPEGSSMEPGGYGASPRIWQEFPRFIQHIATFTEAAQTMASAVREPKRWSTTLAAVRHECLACHQEFRVRPPAK